jgi:hypothetical protein
LLPLPYILTTLSRLPVTVFDLPQRSAVFLYEKTAFTSLLATAPTGTQLGGNIRS